MPGQNNNFFKNISTSLFIGILIFQFLAAPFCEIRGLGFLISNAYAEKDPALEAAKANCKAPQQWTGSRCINPANVVAARAQSDQTKQDCAGLKEMALKDCQEKQPYIQALCEKQLNKKSEESSAEELRGCFNRNKDKDLAQLKGELDWNYDENDSSAMSGVQGGALGINLAMAVTALLAAKQPLSHCTSRMLFSLAAAANLLMEIYFYFLVDNKLRDIKEEYEKTAAQDSYAGQKKAFEYVIQEQQAVADVHSTKFTIYLILAIGYLVPIPFAIYEMFQYRGPQGCTDTAQKKPPKDESAPKPPVPEQNSPITTSDIKTSYFPLKSEHVKIAKEMAQTKMSSSFGHLKNIFTLANIFLKDAIIQKAFAESTFDDSQDNTGKESRFRREKDKDFTNSNTFLKLITSASMAGVAAAFISFSSKVRNFLMSSLGIMIMSGISSTFGFIMSGFSRNAADEAENHKRSMERILQVFSKGLEGKCDSRDNLSEPKCYCYNEDGSKNPSRTKSQTCQDLWKADGMVAPPKAQNKAVAGSLDPKGCITISGEFDQDCKCKMVTQAQGKNLCRTGFLPTQLGSLGNASGMNDVVKQLNNMTNGNFTRGQMNPAETKKLAARMRDMAKKLKEQNKDFLKSKGYDSTKDKDMAKALANLLTKEEIAKYSPGNQLAALTDSPPAGITPESLKDAREKAGIPSASYQGGGGNSLKKDGDKAPAFGFAGDSGGGSGKDLNFMEKQYDYKANDIVKNDDASIWQVISNRYNVSGLKRLFDDSTEVSKKEVNP